MSRSVMHNTQEHTILLIDDDVAIQQMVASTVQQNEYKILYGKTRSEAYNILASMIPDVILLDIHMPQMDGIDLLKAIGNDSNLRNVPVLILTSDTSQESVSEAYKLNVYDYIEKPVNAILLLKRIEQALERKNLNSKLNDRELRIKAMERSAGVWFWEYDSETDTVNCSDELRNMLDDHQEPDGLGLQAFMALVHEQDLDELTNTIQTLVGSGGKYALEHRIYDETGHEAIVLHQGEVLRKENRDAYTIQATLIDVTEQRNTQELIELNAFYDKLTGLPNRDHFCNTLGSLMSQADRQEKLLAVVFVGIDRFKNINDSLGHSVGDELLIRMTERLQQYQCASIARYSGDIFSFVVDGLSRIDEATTKIDRIQALFSEPFKLAEHELYITTSIGVSIYPLQNGDKEQLVNNAESALNFAKNAGGNRAICFDRKMTVTGRRRLFIETDMRKALEKEQFEVYYQPQVSVQNRSLVGMEALIRWNHPEHGLISPDDFIPIAEETGLIIPIGQWVLETATQQVADWIKQGYGLLRVGVNLSPMQFENKSLVKDIDNALLKSGLFPCSLDLEITESSAMRDVRQTISLIHEFNEMGVQTSMDDFGTGYSSLSYLKQMPLHTLKIDRSFVKDIHANGENSELAQLIIGLCHTLGLNVIAEGVETEEHMNFLLEHNCIEAQAICSARQ